MRRGTRSVARSNVASRRHRGSCRWSTIVVVGYVGMVAVLIGVGELIVHAGALGGLRQWDDDVTSWMADHRTAFLDGLTGFLTRVADTMGVVADRRSSSRSCSSCSGDGGHC